jgi:hypothetical protein
VSSEASRDPLLCGEAIHLGGPDHAPAFRLVESSRDRDAPLLLHLGQERLNGEAAALPCPGRALRQVPAPIRWL